MSNDLVGQRVLLQTFQQYLAHPDSEREVIVRAVEREGGLWRLLAEHKNGEIRTYALQQGTGTVYHALKALPRDTPTSTTGWEGM